MSLSLRTRVLGAYRDLQRSQRSLFSRDDEACARAREHIRAQFLENRSECEVSQIEARLLLAAEVRSYLDAGVVQVEQERGTGRIHLRPTTHLTRNVEPTDVFENDMRWPHERHQDAATVAASSNTPTDTAQRQRCEGCACD